MVLPDYLHVFLLVCLCSTTLASNIQLQSDNNNALGVKSRDVQCTNPSPEAINPTCYCSHRFDYETDEYLGRFLSCNLWMNIEPELIHDIFSKFDETNNKFYEVQIYKSSLANIPFDENTTGKLIMERFTVNVYDDFYGTPLIFKETAFENSNSVLSSISVTGYSSNCNWNFGPGTLDNLNNLTYLYLYNYDYDSGPFPPSVLFSLQDLNFEGETTLYNFAHVTMPNLRKLRIYYYRGLTLPANMLYNLPGLEHFTIWFSNIETIPDGFFTYVTSCKIFLLTDNKIKTIDLGSPNPNAWVGLSNNQINQLPEKNFRPFVENVLYTPNASGSIELYGNPLECSCDIKWLVVDLRDGLQIFQGAQCADGRALADVDPVLLEIECPDY